MKQVILIDGNSLLFRAFFAMRPMVTSKGIHTQGVFAFINMLNKIITDYKPDYIAVAFDMKEKTFRHERYSEYKAGRQQTPIELLTEIPILHKVLEAMNIATLEMPGYEADDIIGTLSVKASEQGFRTLVISGDKDELQLVDENVNVLINKKGMSEFDLYDLEAMNERYGLTPAQFIDLKALMGDKSDNIPGIAGIGEKKGISLLQTYSTLDEVLAHADEIPGKMGENVRNGIDSARLSKWLATIKTDTPIDFDWADLEYTDPDIEELINIYIELEFNTFIKKLTASQNESEDAAPAAAAAEMLPGAQSIRQTGFEEFLAEVAPGSRVIIEMATDASHLREPEISSLVLYSPENNLAAGRDVTPMELPVLLGSVADHRYSLCGCGLKRILYSMLAYTDAEFKPCYDAAIAEYLIDPNRQKYSLDKMLLRHNGYAVSEEERKVMSDELNDNSSGLKCADLLERAYYIGVLIPEQEKHLREEALEE